MSDQILILALDTANLGKKLDLEELIVGINTVQRERHQVAGASALEIAAVKNADPARTLYGLVTRPIKSQSAIYRNINLNKTGVVVKASPGSLRSVWAINLNNAAALRYLKLYDKATAATSADTPTMTIPLFPGIPTPLKFDEAGFAAGCSARATTGFADLDNVDPSANEVFVVIETV